MSYDFRFLGICDHTIFERRRIEPDGKTIKVNFPIASDRVKVFRNGKSVRREPIQSSGVVAAPVVETGVVLSDFVFEIGATETEIGAVVDVFNQTKNVNYILTDAVKRSPRRFQLSGKFSLNANNVPDVGDVIQVSYDHSIYGWVIVSDTQGSSDFRVMSVADSLVAQKKSVVLKRETRALDDVWEVKYITEPGFCRKCSGNLVLFDMILDRAGRIQKVRDEEKMDQDFRRMFLTNLGTHPEHAWIGTRIKAAIGSKLLSRRRLRIAQEVQDVFEKLVDLQSKQRTYQEVTEGERVGNVLGIKADQGGDTILVAVNMISRAGNKKTVKNRFADISGRVEADQI